MPGVKRLRSTPGVFPARYCNSEFPACCVLISAFDLSQTMRKTLMFQALRTSVFIVGMTLALSISMGAQTAPPADLDAYVASSMKGFDVPGMAVAIVKDGKVVVAKGYGVRKLGDATPVDDFTMFAIGSNTKAFTTAALATLVDAGQAFMG